MRFVEANHFSVSMAELKKLIAEEDEETWFFPVILSLLAACCYAPRVYLVSLSLLQLEVQSENYMIKFTTLLLDKFLRYVQGRVTLCPRHSKDIGHGTGLLV